MDALPQSPLRVCSFESRRADEMRSLIVRHGAVATVAPSMREVPLEEHDAVFDFAERLWTGTIDIVVFMTGVGARTLLEIVQTRFEPAEFFAALERCVTVVRGPKPAAVLKEWGVRIDLRVPEPNTWRELLAALDGLGSLSGKRIAVQEYGRPNRDFYRELQARGASVEPVPVYRWDLPEDIEPLKSAIRDTLDRRFDVILFTSAQQLHNLLEVAESLGLRESWIEAANRCAIASIGPTATETLREEGLVVDLEPSHPKMGHLVREALAAAPTILAAKRA